MTNGRVTRSGENPRGMSAWILDYLGRPWAAGAAGPEAYDCWGLVRAVYRDRLNIEVPPIDVDAMRLAAVARAFEASPEYAQWYEVANPAPCAIALMSHGARPHHVGLWTGEAVLHAIEGAGVIHQSLASLAVHGWRVLVYYQRRESA